MNWKKLVLKWKKVQNYRTSYILHLLQIDFPNLPFFKYFGWIYTACAYENNGVTWNDKSAGKCKPFSEEYPKCGRFWKKI